ncbi:unnamed protein product [Rotaria sp. Silwood1]|nr:unnamed protein product [Rotaria sp. Silwood1]CAF4791515.1 unnamed protein product [Rotaria sp. Silwood1]
MSDPQLTADPDCNLAVTLTSTPVSTLAPQTSPVTNGTALTTTPSPCQNGGVSVNGACKCPSGYNGTNCQLKQDADLCRNIRCRNYGVCAIRKPNVLYEAVCLCRANFSGEYCEQQGTPGYCSTSSCMNGAACREEVIGATRTAYCDCPLGYRGVKCENRYFTCNRGAGTFLDDEMHEQGKYFVCQNGTLRLEQRSCPKGLRFNLGTQACTDG